MFPHVHLSKGADISDTRHIYSEVPEEINNGPSLVSESEVEDERSEQGTQNLIHYGHLQECGVWRGLDRMNYQYQIVHVT